MESSTTLQTSPTHHTSVTQPTPTALKHPQLSNYNSLSNMVDSNGSGSRTWFITGISKGIGTEVAVAALKHGDTVIGTVRSKDLPEQLNNQKNLHVLTVDVTDEQKTKEAVDRALQLASHKIDVLVNNAGSAVCGAVEEVPLQQWRQQFDLNVFALVQITQLILPSMRQNKSGHIINLSSCLGRATGPGWSVYSASKYAVEAISESLAEEVKSFGIKVTSIEPGYIRYAFLSIYTRFLLPRQLSQHCLTRWTCLPSHC